MRTGERYTRTSAGTDAVSVDLLVDAHVHVYEGMPVRRLLEAASRNFAAHCSSDVTDQNVVLLVADPEGVRGFERLREYGRGSRADDQTDWRIEEDESRSFTLRRPHGCSVTVIRGQQLITREDLEVLGIGCKRSVASGLPLATTIDRIRAADGWSIIAWGVGKWIGRRGRIVTETIAAEAGGGDVMLGDNGGRPRIWSRIPQFRMGMERGMRIVAGTDPLPLKGEEDRVGSYASRVRGLRRERQLTAEVLRQALSERHSVVSTVGAQVGAGRFLSNQLRLRLQQGWPFSRPTGPHHLFL